MYYSIARRCRSGVDWLEVRSAAAWQDNRLMGVSADAGPRSKPLEFSD